MTPFLIEAPAAEPLSLDEARSFLRLDGIEEDGLLAALLTSARLTVEAVSGLALVHQTWCFLIDPWPRGRTLKLPMAPIDSVLAVRGRAADGPWSDMPASFFKPAATAERNELLLADDAAPMTAVEVDVRLGFGAPSDVPAPLRQAVRLLVAHWFENRGDASDANRPPLPPDVVALLAPYRRMRL